MRLRRSVLLSLALLTLLPGRALLGEQPPAPVRTDHYGDPLPKDARFRLGSVRLRHDGMVRTLAWSPDGRILVSFWEQTGLRLWQIPGGKQLINKQPAQADTLEGFFCSLSPDGRTWMWRDLKDALHVMDLASGKELRRIEPGHCPGELSPDGKFSVAVEGKGLRLYAVDTGKKLHFLETKLRAFDNDPTILFTPDSRSLIVNTQDGIFCWDLGTGKKHHKLGRESLDSFAIAPNGKTLATAKVGEDGQNIVTLWSWPECKRLHRLTVEKEGDPVLLAFSANGKLLATGGWSGIVRLWNLADGKQLRHFVELEDRILALSFSPDGTLIAAACDGGRVIVWEVNEEKPSRPLMGVRHLLSLVGLSADGKTLLTRSVDGTLTAWDARDGRHLRTLREKDENAEHFLFGPDAGRTRVDLWQDVVSGRPSPPFSKQSTNCSAFSPDNTMLAEGGIGNVLLVRKTVGRVERRVLLPKAAKNAKAESNIINSVRALAFSPDGRTLAAIFADGGLSLWDSRTGQLRHSISLPPIGVTFERCLAFSPNSRLLAISNCHEIQLIETASRKQARKLRCNRAWITSLTFAPDNRTLAVGTWGSVNDDSTVEPVIDLWDLPTEKRINVLSGHDKSIRTLVFSPDCASLYSGGEDYTVLCWDVAAVMKRRLPSKKLSTAKLTELWTDLASKDALHGQQAAAEMIQAPDAALPFLEKSLPPVPPAEMARIAALIADLDHAEFARREKASRELEQIGTPAALALRKTLTEKPSLEMRRRIDALLEVIEARPLSPKELRTIRAVQVLETIGTPVARRILEGLSGGAAEAMLTLEAKAALQRLEHRNRKP